MDELHGSGFDDFSIEMEDFEYVQVKSFDRVFDINEGGSMAEKPLVHNGKVYFGSMDRNVYALDAQTGTLAWKYTADGGIIASSPVVSEGILYIGSYDYNLYALDVETGSLAWKFHTREKVLSTATVHGGRVYFGSNDRNLYCLDSRTGKMVWKFETQGEVISHPMVHEGLVYFGSYDHFLYCLDAGTGRLKWKFETQGNVLSQSEFLIKNNIIYFPSFDNYLRAVDIKSGRLVWKILTGHYGGMSSGPKLHGNMLMQSNREGVLLGLTLDGKERWSFRINEAMATPIVYDGRIYIGAADHNLYCIGMDGKALWSFRTQGEVWWEPTAWKGKIYFTSWDCNMYCVDTRTRQLVWKFRTHGAPSPLPHPFGTHELVVRKSAGEDGLREWDGRKAYDIGGLQEEGGSAYKSRVTYRVSSQYAAKGKYQTDSDEERL